MKVETIIVSESIATKGRIRKELAECQKDVETTGVCAEMKSNQMDHLVGK